MFRKTSKFLLRFAAAIVTGVAVLAVLGLWRLSQGPVSLDFALPYLQQGADAPDGSVKFAAREVTLNWAGWDRTMEIHVGAIQALGPTGEVLATVPQAAIKLSLLALLAGEVAPTSIQLERLRLNVVLGEDGRLDLGQPQGNDDTGSHFLSLVVDQLLTRDGRIAAIRRLERVVVTGAEIVFEDRRKSIVWRAPNAEIVLARDEEGVLGEAAVEIEAEGQRSVVNLRALFSREDRSFAVAANFEGIRPSVFAAADSTLALLSQLDLAFSGTVDARISARGAIEAMTVNVASGAGTIGEVGVFAAEHAVESAALRGEFNVDSGMLRVDALTVDFGESTMELSGEGSLAAGQFDFAGVLEVDRLRGADLGKYWPVALSPGGRSWAVENIEGGGAESFRLSFGVSGDTNSPESVAVGDVAGSMTFSGLAVHYLRPMPPVTGVSGTMKMTDAVVVFDIDAGQMGDVSIEDGTIRLENLDQPDGHRADIDLTASGPMASMLRVLEHPKVGLPKDVAVKPDRVGGQVATRVLVQLPLVDDLTMAQVEYAASATTLGLSVKDVVSGIDLSEAALTLQITGKDMDVRGKGKLGGHAADIQWRENFGRAAFRRRYDVRTTVSAADLGRISGRKFEQVEGPIGIHAIYTETGPQTGSLAATLDLRQAAIDVPEIGWRKEGGRDASGKIGVEIRNSRPADRVDLEIAAADLRAQGHVMLGADGAFLRTEIDRLSFGRNSLRGSVARTVAGYSVVMAGDTLDLTPLLADDAGGPPASDAAGAVPKSGPIYDLRVDLGQVLTKRGRLDGVAGAGRFRDGRVLSADLTGRAGRSADVTLRVEPSQKGRRLTVEATDMGAVLKSLGWLEGMIGGDMRLSGEFDDSRAGSPLRGFLRVGSYKLVNTPVVGDVLTVAPLTDALSAFSGSGLAFDRLLAPFVWQTGILTLGNARTAGTSLGLTASGRVNTRNDTVQIDGTIVPAYVLNSLLGNIPLIGPLITGGPGGGIFGINYAVEGPVAKPDVSVNPLSALAPGFLRNLFSAGSGEEISDDNGENAPQPAPVPAPGGSAP